MTNKEFFSLIHTHRYQSFVVFVLSIIFAQFLIETVHYTLQDRREPVIWYNATTAQTPELVEKEQVKITYEGKRIRYCNAEITDFWIDPEGNRVKTFDTVTGGYTDIGEFKTSFIRPTPKGPPGTYMYRSRVDHFCENGIHNGIQPPDAIFIKK